MEIQGRRWPVALAAALVVAEVAVALLRPRHGVIDPVPVEARSYFSAAEIARADAFRSGQLVLYGGRLVLQAGLLIALVRRPPGWLQRPGRVLARTAIAGAALSLALALVVLPLSAVAHQRAVDVGLSTRSWAGWLGDVALAGAIAAGETAVVVALGLALVRRLPRAWPLPGALAVVAVGAAFAFASPVVLDPLFNTFKPLPAGPVRSDVLDLARRSGVDVGEVYVIDASKRTAGANAYVAGLGRTKRVVLYDTLLERFSRDEVRLVVAHELGHVHFRDVPHGLLYLALVAPLGLLAVRELTARLAPAGARPGAAASLPALALALALVSTGIVTISNQLSRRVEARADSYSLELTGEPAPFISFERRITVSNVSDPDPPDWVGFLLGTHPASVQRIGAAEAFERRRDARPSSGPAPRPPTPAGS